MACTAQRAATLRGARAKRRRRRDTLGICGRTERTRAVRAKTRHGKTVDVFRDRGHSRGHRARTIRFFRIESATLCFHTQSCILYSDVLDNIIWSRSNPLPIKPNLIILKYRVGCTRHSRLCFLNGAFQGYERAKIGIYENTSIFGFISNPIPPVLVNSTGRFLAFVSTKFGHCQFRRLSRVIGHIRV